MKDFAALYRGLDASTSNLAKQAALQAYLRAAAPADAAWAVYFLAGGKPRQLVPTKLLRQFAREAAGLPEWLFDESYEAVGDLAETIALLLPPPTDRHELGLAEWVEQHLLPLRGQSPEALEPVLRAQWARLAPEERLVYFKLITGAFRVGVSKLQVTQALAAVGGLDPKRVAQRLMGYTHIGARPGAADYERLVAPQPKEGSGDGAGGGGSAETSGHPYPFFLAHPFALPVEQFDATLGPPGDWIVEWKWDGIRAQLVRRAGATWVWSRGEELVSDRFPELQRLGEDALPDGTVLDGEIVVWQPAEGGTAAHVRPFADLQKRIGRKTLGPKLLRELPVVLLAYDLLEEGGQDLRALPQHERRARLDALLARTAHPSLVASPVLHGASWQDPAARAGPLAGRGGDDAQGPRRAVRRGPHQGRGDVVEMEDRPLEHRCRADLRAARPRAPREPLQRLHLRGLGRPSRHGRPHARAVREGVFGPDRCRDGTRGRGHPAHDAGDLRAGAQREADAGVRAGVRRNRTQRAAQERHRGAVSAHAAVARGQAGGGSRFPRHARGAAAGGRRSLTARTAAVPAPARGRPPPR